MSHHVLRTMQLSSNIPNDNKHDLLQPNHCTSCDSIYGQHLGIHKNNWRILTGDDSGYGNPITQQPIPKTNEVLLWSQHGRIPRIHHLHGLDLYGPSQSQWKLHIANSDKPQRSPIVSRLQKLLSKIYLRLRNASQTPQQPDKKKHPLHMDWLMPQHIHTP